MREGVSLTAASMTFAAELPVAKEYPLLLPSSRRLKWYVNAWGRSGFGKKVLGSLIPR